MKNIQKFKFTEWTDCQADKLQQTTEMYRKIEVWWEIEHQILFNWTFMHKLIILIKI